MSKSGRNTARSPKGRGGADHAAAAKASAVLFTCIGRRVSLLQAFRRAARRLRRPMRFYGTDTSSLSPALQSCDEAFLVRPTSHARYVGQLLSIVRRHAVGLLVPTVDLDLRVLAEHRRRFEACGCRVLVSDPEVIDLCQDKRRTYDFLRRNGFDCPLTQSVDSALKADRKGSLVWPCFLKPWDGHAGKDSMVVHDRKELLFYAKRVPNAICQELIKGAEYTCDVYVDFEKRVRSVVPRRRLEVRWGEISKGQVVKNERIMAEAARLARQLGVGPGVITLQLFLTNRNEIKFLEVNPRFGGGVPLSIKAGADFPKWILQELAGRRLCIGFDAFQDGLMMLRYDAEVWIEGADLRGTKV
ncbi:MAG: ATP-grasp domain-containing protein [Phycisphaerales bacterium]|nr:MAG: ATP-grasp domain-containing protein [Phycisphaerales bacterium]